MPLAVSDWLFMLGVAVTTVGALFTCARSDRIANKLVYASFIAGWAVQATIHPHSATTAGALKDAALAFAVGFGPMLLLWFFGLGGGSVKLMGALSIWLGFKMTSIVALLSISMGIAATVAVIIGESLLQSRRPMEVVEATDQPGHESSGPPGRARISIAFPYIVITIVWIVVIWFKLISPAG